MPMHPQAAVRTQQPLRPHVRRLVQQILRHATAAVPHVQHAWRGRGTDEHRVDEKGGLGLCGAMCTQDFLNRYTFSPSPGISMTFILFSASHYMLCLHRSCHSIWITAGHLLAGFLCWSSNACAGSCTPNFLLSILPHAAL